MSWCAPIFNYFWVYNYQQDYPRSCQFFFETDLTELAMNTIFRGTHQHPFALAVFSPEYRHLVMITSPESPDWLRRCLKRHSVALWSVSQPSSWKGNWFPKRPSPFTAPSVSHRLHWHSFGFDTRSRESVRLMRRASRSSHFLLLTPSQRPGLEAASYPKSGYLTPALC